MRLRRRQRLPATFRRPRFDAEQSHDAVADEFVDHTAGAGDALADRFEITVQQENQIVRQFLLGDAGKRAQIGEQDRDGSFLTGEIGRLRVTVARVRIGGHERRN